jgi:transcription elongation factor GreB
MSRGFVKEDDQEDIPLVPPRATLPDGVPNYVTPAGMKSLLEERQMLFDEKERLDNTNEREKRIALNHINAKLQLLNARIAEAKVINLQDQPRGEVRFGAKVTMKIEANNSIRVFQIVGVDEADISKGKISFLSPIAKALINKKKGGKAVLKHDGKESVYLILDIHYA